MNFRQGVHPLFGLKKYPEIPSGSGLQQIVQHKGLAKSLEKSGQKPRL